MKIIQLTPGTGNFYCGNCIRDNSLIPALRRLGHDAIMLPMYLPIISENLDPSAGQPLFFGGINVYLQQKIALFRKTPRWVDNLFDSTGLLRWMAGLAHMTRARDLGEMTISILEGEDGRQTKELNRLVDWIGQHEKPDVVHLSNVLLSGLARSLKQRLGVPVFCTLTGEDAFLDSLSEPYKGHAWRMLAERVRDLDGLIAVSHYFGNVMGHRLGLGPSHLHVVYNGIDLDGFEPAATQPQPPVLGFFARMIHGKGLTTLIEAFALLKSRPATAELQLHLGGSITDAEKTYHAGLRKRLQEQGLTSSVKWMPNLTRAQKLDFYKGLTVFSVPANHGEAFGLYILAALAAGVPVVQPRHGAFPELIDAIGGGKLCEPDDPAALADAIESLILKPEEARALGARGRQKVLAQFGVDRMAVEIIKVYESVLAAVAG